LQIFSLEVTLIRDQVLIKVGACDPSSYNFVVNYLFMFFLQKDRGFGVCSTKQALALRYSWF